MNMKSIPSRLIPVLVIGASLSAFGFAGCNKQDHNSVDDNVNAARDNVNTAMSDTRAAMGNAWDNVKSYTYERRDDFSAHAKATSSKLDAEISQLRTNYSEAKASASRKAAMAELKDAEADYKSKLDALGNASAATWDSAKQNVILAWDRTQAAYHKARAD